MATTLKQVLDALTPEGPAYAEAAAKLGVGAVPHLRAIVRRNDPLLAGKAVSLAGHIQAPEASDVLFAASRSKVSDLRVAAAHAARHCPADTAEQLLRKLLADADGGVRKVASRTVLARPLPGLRPVLEARERIEPNPRIRKNLQLALKG
jgi:HEAT repeat protein